MLRSGNQRVPLHEACIGGHLETVQLLIDVMSDINIQDKDGQTAAHLAAFNGEVECMKVLIQYGEYIQNFYNFLILIFILYSNEDAHENL